MTEITSIVDLIMTVVSTLSIKVNTYLKHLRTNFSITAVYLRVHHCFRQVFCSHEDLLSKCKSEMLKECILMEDPEFHKFSSINQKKEKPISHKGKVRAQ